MYQPFSGDFLQWIHTFLSVADTRSVQRSAVILCLSPSAVSFQIRKLERELDCALFERSKHGMTPTYEGLRLKKDVRPILAALDELRHGAERRPLEGSVRLSCLDHVAPELILHILRFREAHPDVHFMLEPTHSAQVRQLVETGMVDFGVTIQRDFPGFIQFTELRPSSAFLYTPVDNPYRLPDMPSWERICELPFIALTMEGYVNPILATVPDMPQPHNVIIAINNFLLALHLVKKGVGACIAPPLTRLESPTDFTIFNIDHIFAIGTLGAIKRRAKILSPLAEAFFDFLRANYARADRPSARNESLSS